MLFCFFTLSTNLRSCDHVTPSAMMNFLALISPLPYSAQFWTLSFSLAWEYESRNSTIYLHIEIGQEQIYADSKFSHIWEDKQHSQLVQKLLSLGSHCLATHNSYRGTDEIASKFWRIFILTFFKLYKLQTSSHTFLCNCSTWQKHRGVTVSWISWLQV